MTSNEVALATIAAIFLGPFLAIGGARYLDSLRAAKARKLEIFRTLMRTRGLPMDREHVGSLNLVEVEFLNHQDVIDAWKAYLAKLREELPPIEQKPRYDTATRKRDSLLTKLIDTIAKALNIKVAQLDILEGNYVPQGWHDDDWEQRLVRRGIINVLHGRAAISIQQPQPQQEQNPYPPPPDSK